MDPTSVAACLPHGISCTTVSHPETYPVGRRVVGICHSLMFRLMFAGIPCHCFSLFGLINTAPCLELLSPPVNGLDPTEVLSIRSVRCSRACGL
ncbi:MAG: hypothetical protein HQL78_00060 [Magnetococcales bacterium]|nr:hypothetical protein [Magnetococcales bacterium]